MTSKGFVFINYEIPLVTKFVKILQHASQTEFKFKKKMSWLVVVSVLFLFEWSRGVKLKACGPISGPPPHFM